MGGQPHAFIVGADLWCQPGRCCGWLSLCAEFFGETNLASPSIQCVSRLPSEDSSITCAVARAGKGERSAGVRVSPCDRQVPQATWKFYEENKKLSIRKANVSTLLSLIGTLGYYSAYAIIVVRAMRGEMSIGTLTFLAGSFARSRQLIQGLLMGAGGIYQQCLYLKDLFDFFEMKPSIASTPNAPPVPIVSEIRVRRRRLSISGERGLGNTACELCFAAR